jgi:predicted RNA-binding Zn-ribbon protein involved in translation (DUF1610 family)
MKMEEITTISAASTIYLADVRVMVCEVCGKQFRESNDYRFEYCPMCGRKIVYRDNRPYCPMCGRKIIYHDDGPY